MGLRIRCARHCEKGPHPLTVHIGFNTLLFAILIETTMSENTADVKKESLKLDSSKFLSEIIGNAVTVKLHNGVEYLGKLQSIDGYMNIVLDETREVINGNVGRTYGDVFLRGNNGKYLQYLKLPFKLKVSKKIFERFSFPFLPTFSCS